VKVLLARWQFGVTITYHFLFVPLTIGLALLVAVMQVLAYRRRDETWERLIRFFGTLFLINFAMCVVTGIVQEFQFGMNWSNYSVFVGNIFGAPGPGPGQPGARLRLGRGLHRPGPRPGTTRSPVESCSGSAWPGPCWPTGLCCCSTNPPGTWMRPRPTPCSKPCWTARSAARCCGSLTGQKSWPVSLRSAASRSIRSSGPAA